MEKENLRQNNIIWNLAVRDDEYVAKHVKDNKEMDAIYSLKEAGLLDEFFQFLQEMNIIELIKEVKYKDVQREMVEFFQYIFLYICKIILGIKSQNSLPDLLFSNTAAMGLVGFNAYQVKNGICNRGDDKRKTKEKQGPICPPTLSNNIVKIPKEEVEKLLNKAISKIAENKLLPERILAILDTTDIETTEKFKGAKSVTRKKRIKDKSGKEKEVEITVWGFKLLALYHYQTKIPLAAKLININEQGNKYTQEILKIAKDNLGNNCKIKCVVMDREFLDGEDLWELHKKDIHFVVPAKTNMQVFEDAKILAFKEGREEDIRVIESRIREVSVGKGKNKKIEKKETILAGIKGLISFDQYGPKGNYKNRYKKSFTPRILNAVVVLTWDGDDYGKKGGPVYLTDLPVDNPFLAFDYYDERSCIENSLFREGKQKWYFKKPPKRNEEGIITHIFLTLFVLSLTSAYWGWKRTQEDEKELLGIERWRMRLKRENQEKVIVFVEKKYGIFYNYEVIILSGARVKDFDENKIFEKYNIRAP